MNIIEAGLEDISTIKDLAYKIWPVTYGAILSDKQLAYMLDSFYDEATLQDAILNKGHHFLLAVDGATSIGFASYEHNYKEELTTRIHKIYLLPETQGKGYGKQLIDHISTLAIANKMTALSLNVNRFNKALSFYQKIGFKIIAQEDIHLDHGYLMEDYVMELPLL